MEKIKNVKEAGNTFELAGLKWTVLEVTEKGYMCLAERLDNMQFGTNNYWKESSIRKYLNVEFLERLGAEIGAENIVEFERDLLSMDGQTEYGYCMDKVSLLNVDEYRKYRKHIPNAGYWWWLLTADSTKSNDDDRWMTVVSPSGVICSNFYGFNNGVRPFCIFSSSIFESEE